MRPDPSRSRRRWLAWAMPLAGVVLLAAALLSCSGPEGGHTAATKPAKPAPTGGIGGTGFADNGLGGTGLADRRSGGIGGTGLDAERPGGIGGTGLADSRTGGIGGTGLSEGGVGGTGLKTWGQVDTGGIGGTGIVGVLMDEDTIRINGLKVALTPETVIRQGSTTGSRTDLAAGQLLAIQVEDRNGTAVAHTIDLVVALEGPVEAEDAATGSLRVLGQQVIVSDATALPQGTVPSVGTMVLVSGLSRSDGSIVASRVSPVGSGAMVRLSGELTREGERWAVAGTPVTFTQHVNPAPHLGRPVVIAGRWQGNRINATELEADPVDALFRRVAQVHVQGYLSKREQEGTIQVGRSRVPVHLASARLQGDPAPASGEQLIVLSAMVEPDGSFSAKAIRTVPRRIGDVGGVPAPSNGPAGQGGKAMNPSAGNPHKPFFAGSGNPWGGPPQSPPKGPPPGVPGRGGGGGGGGGGPPCGTPPCGKGGGKGPH